MAYAQGLDVSHHQGVIRWNQVRSAGYTFAFIRATYVGTKTGQFGVDRKFVENWQQAQSVGLLTSAYHYFVPQIGSTAQIDHFLNTFGGRIASFPLVLDFEFAAGLTKEQVTDCIVSAVQKVTHDTGRKPIIYTRASWWRRFVSPVITWADFDIWAANYENPSGPLLPPGWSDWRFWQWTEKGQIPGCAGMFDLNWFKGTDAELLQYAAR